MGKKNYGPMVAKTCAVCGKEFYTNRARVTCSDSCARKLVRIHMVRKYEAKKEAEEEMDDETPRPCKNCGKVFTPFTVVEDLEGIHVSGKYTCCIACTDQYYGYEPRTH